MLIRHSLAVAAMLALVLPVAHAAPARSDTAMLSAKEKPARHRSRHAGQIACTVAGCQRIPPQCHPETEYDWDGVPTGFDMIVCGPRRR